MGRFSGDAGDDLLDISGFGIVSHEDAPNGIVIDPGGMARGWGEDQLTDSGEGARIVGSRFDDVIDGGSWENAGVAVSGLGGDDVVLGSGERDFLDGGPGEDVLYGFLGRDEISGGPGSDPIFGGDGERLY